MTPIPAPVAALAREESSLVDQLVHWSEQNSGSGNLKGLLSMAEMLEEAFHLIPNSRLRRIQLPDTSAPALLVSSRSDNKRRVLCSGHYDTVYEASHPFQKCNLASKEKLKGPGVADMKGGLLVMLAALQCFERLDCAPLLGWDVLLTPDEETGSAQGGAALKAIAPGHECALVFEPARANGDLVKARMATGTLLAHCWGRSAHAAQQPNNGRNAITGLARFVAQVESLTSQLEGAIINIGSISGGGPLNVVPDRATAGINIRARDKEAAEALLNRLQHAARSLSKEEGLSITLEGGFDRPPKVASSYEEALFAEYQSFFPRLKQSTPQWQSVGGGSDGNLLSELGIPNLDGLGVIGGQLHSIDEYCEPNSLVPRAQAAALLLESLALRKVRDLE